MSLKSEARGWTNHLLCYLAAHMVNLFALQAGSIVGAHALQGPLYSDLGIGMDMSIQVKAKRGAIWNSGLRGEHIA